MLGQHEVVASVEEGKNSAHCYGVTIQQPETFRSDCASIPGHELDRNSLVSSSFSTWRMMSGNPVGSHKYPPLVAFPHATNLADAVFSEAMMIADRINVFGADK
ncbi:hypothetical protein O1611_g9732 [Lasiodiplodia mahajangana]|uniref:Uncharacterized protein n=1 Tax=Lasiodiplodia mahajangana TaxID=1108764 RepID=A0ACC2J6A1_9PEZI|nr:hypothetical protein O1611_g9732 [Lasiodiplodia mahajangana]